jgi:hypothetical protein
MLLVEAEPEGLLEHFERYQVPTVAKWVERTGA